MVLGSPNMKTTTKIYRKYMKLGKKVKIMKIYPDDSMLLQIF